METQSVVKQESEDTKSDNSEETEVVKKSVKKSISPQKAKIEKEKTTPETKKGAKNVMSFFIKKEFNGNEGEATESGVVTGEDSIGRFKIFSFQIILLNVQEHK